MTSHENFADFAVLRFTWNIYLFFILGTRETSVRALSVVGILSLHNLLSKNKFVSLNSIMSELSITALC